MIMMIYKCSWNIGHLALNNIHSFKFPIIYSEVNTFFSYLSILASCFKIVLAKLELHLPLIAAKYDPDSKITIF
jgi:hypothetical protein